MREMKDSGIEWIGKIPVEWNISRTKYFYSTHKTIAGIKSTDYERLALTMNGVVKRSKTDDTGLQPDNFDTYQILRSGELVFKLIDLQNVSTSRVGLSPYTGLVSPAYIILAPNEGIVSEFGHYYFLSLWHREIFNHLGDDGVRSSLNSCDLLEIPYPILSSFEQHRIADFLDAKCSEIDSLASDIRSEIDTLEQYMRSVITEAVTRGLDPEVEMKDSGAAWIGKIPIHWRTDKIKYYLRRNEIRNPGNQPVLSVYRKYGVIPKDSRDDNHNVTSEDVSKYKYVKPGYLVINKMKAWQGSMGVSQYEGIVSPAYFIYEFTNDLIEKTYLHYLFRTCYKDEFRRISGGIREGQWDLSPEAFANTLLPVPPIGEQQRIVEYIQVKCAAIERVIALKYEQLFTLDSYKKSLIFEYVTGKKEVPVS